MTNVNKGFPLQKCDHALHITKKKKRKKANKDQKKSEPTFVSPFSSKTHAIKGGKRVNAGRFRLNFNV